MRKLFLIYLISACSMLANPLHLIENLKEEMSPQNQKFISFLIKAEIKKNNREIEILKDKMSIAYGGKMLSQIHFKEELQEKIEYLESRNELLNSY